MSEKPTEYVKYPHQDYVFADELELGWRVSGAIYRENTGPEWGRDGIIQVRIENHPCHRRDV